MADLIRARSPLALATLFGALLLGAGLFCSNASAQAGPASALGDPRTGAAATAIPSPRTAPQSSRTDASDLTVPPPPGGESVGIPAMSGQVSGLDDGLRVPSPITTRLRALEGNLRSIGGSSAGSILNAILSVAGGALSITLGAMIDTNCCGIGLPDPSLSSYLYVYGSAAVVRGVLDPILAPNASGPATEMTNMPMTTLEEVHTRLRFGENALSSLAERALISRILDGSINIAAGLAVIPIYLGPKDFEVSAAMDYFVIIASGISVITGAITLFSPSGAEQRWSAYERLRDRVSPEEREGDEQSQREEAELAVEELRAAAAEQSEAPSLDLQLSPTYGGAYLGLSGSF